jgi:hypothetical protein
MFVPRFITISESVPPETLEQLEALGYHFETLPAPFNPEELQAVVFGALKPKSQTERDREALGRRRAEGLTVRTDIVTSEWSGHKNQTVTATICRMDRHTAAAISVAGS